MSYWEVKDYLNQLVDFTDDETDLILPLCRSSLQEIEAKLKPETDSGDIRIVVAAAGIAYYNLMLRRSSKIESSMMTSFKAGDVSVTNEIPDRQKQLEKAEHYRQKMLENIIPLCVDNNFAFEQIEVMAK